MEICHGAKTNYNIQSSDKFKLLPFRKETSLFLRESQSEGPQGADFQLPSNSYTFTLALTPAPPDHIRQ